MRHDTRLSSAVPHSTAFLPPAFIDTLPPMVEASAEVGSTANTRPAASAASITRLVTTPAPQWIVGTSNSHAGQVAHLHRAQRLELFGVDDRSLVGERHRAAGVAGAAAARDDGQPQFDQPGHQPGHLGFAVRGQHHEGIFHPPVGGVGDMRDARQAVEPDVVAPGDAGQAAQDARAQAGGVGKPGLEFAHRALGCSQQLPHQFVALAPHLDLVQAMPQRVDQHLSPLGVVEQVVFQIGIAPHHPDVAQHLEQHACRAPGLAFAAQRVEHVPCVGAEQANDDLAVGKRGVVVGDFAQACGHAGLCSSVAEAMPNPSALKPVFYGIWAQAVSRHNRTKTCGAYGKPQPASRITRTGAWLRSRRPEPARPRQRRSSHR